MATIADRINAATKRGVVPVPHCYGKSHAIREARMASDGRQVQVVIGRGKNWVWLTVAQVQSLDSMLAQHGL